MKKKVTLLWKLYHITLQCNYFNGRIKCRDYFPELGTKLVLHQWTFQIYLTKTPSLAQWSKIRNKGCLGVALNRAATQTRCSSEPSNTLKHHRHSGNLVIKGKSELAWISHVHWNRALEVSMAAGGATVKWDATYSAPPSPQFVHLVALGSSASTFVFFWSLCGWECWKKRKLCRCWAELTRRIFRFCLWCCRSGRRCCLERREWGMI